MTPCVVKVLQDQWFLNYSDLEWKEKAKQALSKMEIYPETAMLWFQTVIDWLKELAAKAGIDAETLEEMHSEFEYWYPVDLRVSAKELVSNHLTFFIFHHT